MYTVSNVFTDPMNKNTAYLLGYTYADGCISRGSELIYSSIDEELILSVKSILNSDSPIRYPSRSGGYGSGKQTHRFLIARKEVCQTLISLGVKQPDFFPEFYKNTPYMSHYIRGVFDGDGCISLYQDVYKQSIYLKSTWNIILHEDVITKFHNELQPLLSQKISVQKSKTDSMLYLKNSSIKGVLKLGNYLYQDAEYFLKRKYNKFLELRAYVERST